MGQPVLPAVEAMEILAATAKREQPNQSVTSILNARFDKFLPTGPDQLQIAAFVDLQQQDSGDLQVELATKTKSPKATITRTKIHAQLTVNANKIDPEFVPLDVAAAPEGICITVDPEKIYEELVPFGPAYANIKAPVWLSPDGALATIQCPDLPTSSGSNHLGSPFALDAAFHSACVWTQHFHNVVAFPVAIGQRIVLNPTRANTRYFGRVVPQTITPMLFTFDLWLLDETGQVCEIVLGLQMRDVSGGRLKPPAWVGQNLPPDPLAGFRSICRQIAIIELDSLAPYASTALSPLEAKRLDKMVPRRRKSYLSARMALKRIHRRLQDNDFQIDPQTITTVSDDMVKPCCPAFDRTPQIHCSASHDGRFAIAVAADQPVGVDVEVISSKTVKCSSVYMSDDESALMRLSSLGQDQAATRIWSLKEAVAKATGINLATTWRRAQVRSIGEHETHFDFAEKGRCTAMHATVGEHLFTLYRH